MCKKNMYRQKVTSLVLAVFLTAIPVMDAWAVEGAKNNVQAPGDGEEDSEEVISVEDANEVVESYDDEEAEWEEIYIDSVEGLKAFSKKCWLDTWSHNKKVYLTEDLNLAGSGFVPIPTFGGFFDGQGHIISGLSVRDSVSYAGLFNYTQRTAVITNLNVQGAVRPSGSPIVVGGIVGDNGGILINCSFDGTVEGNDYVGGVAGFNELSGILIECKSGGTVTGAHYTGGIAGENVGNIVGCVNEADINTSNEDKAKSLDDINIADYTSGLLKTGEDEEADKEASTVSNTIDSGGIAGLSTGIIQFSTNKGTVGYEHVGYNTGGIVGRQSGYVYACENAGTVYGRKDVGGIAGQTEPYIAIDLSEDIVYQLTENIDKMHDLTGVMLDDAGTESDTLSARLTVVQDFVDKALEDTSFLADRTVGWTDEMIGSVNDAMGRLDYIMEETSKQDGVFDQTREAAGNVKDAAKKLGDAVDTMDIYQYMSSEDRERYENAKANMKTMSDLYAGYRAGALEAAENYYIDYTRKEEKYKDSNGVNEDNLKPRISGVVDATWSGADGKSYEDYEDVEGWVHINLDRLPDVEVIDDFPASNEVQGALDRDLIADATAQMGQNMAAVERYITDYSDVQYYNATGGNYTSDMEGYLSIMSGIVMECQDAMTKDMAKELEKAVDYTEDASDNLHNAGSEAKNIFDTLNEMPDIQLPQLGEDYRSRTNSLTANLQGLSENMGYLNDEMASTNDVLIDDLGDINDQFSTIMKLYTDAIDGVLDMDYTNSYEDTSQEDAESSTDATVADCRNTGTVKGDINVSGIVGTMAIEYDFDLEGDVTGIEDARLNSTFLTKCVLRQNVNHGKITAQKNYAGGITGMQEMGTILRCENYGRIESSTGNYVGGVAGQSLSNIEQSYAKCTVSGEAYVAGIAGSGSDIGNCCAIVRIQDAVSFSGAIAGETSGSGEVTGNYFVSDEIAGIDRISYSGKAEPLNYEEMLEIEGLPNKFRMMTISFCADDEEVKVVECPYGGSVPMQLYPEIPTKDGFYADWDIKDLDKVLYDEDVTAEYVRYLTTLASQQTRDNGQSAILADGMFRQEDMLDVTGGAVSDSNSVDGVTNIPQEELVENWMIKIPEDGEESHQLRYQAPESQTDGVTIYVKKDGGWEQTAPTLMGMYHLFSVDGTEAELAVYIHEKDIMDYLAYLILGAAVLVVLFIMLICKIVKKGKEKRQKSIQEKEESVTED